MNWGNKLLLTFVVFACGIFYLVYRAMHVETELVSKEYYKDELKYQQVIDGTKLANMLSAKVLITQEDKNITVQMPAEMRNEKVSGNIWFYCASDAKKDKHVAIALNAEAAQQIDKKFFMPGNYTVKFDWDNNDRHYHFEEPLTIL
jgi:hypothetical protein